MTYTETVASFVKTGATKAQLSARTPGAFFIGSMLAGAYVGIALILAYTCAAGLPAGVRPLVTGAVFGIGLILVVFAGAEMFTGHVMYSTFGAMGRSVTPLDIARTWALVWIGNLAGAALLSFIFIKGGGGVLFAPGSTFLHDTILKKETSPALELVMRAILCNWMVCLAIWTAARVQNESAKMIAIAWCLLAFVACGFEHSVANMTAVCLGLFASPQIGDVGAGLYNLGWVTLGNIIGGAVLVAAAYAWMARGDAAAPASATPSPQTTVTPTPAAQTH